MSVPHSYNSYGCATPVIFFLGTSITDSYNLYERVTLVWLKFKEIVSLLGAYNTELSLYVKLLTLYDKKGKFANLVLHYGCSYV